MAQQNIRTRRGYFLSLEMNFVSDSHFMAWSVGILNQTAIQNKNYILKVFYCSDFDVLYDTKAQNGRRFSYNIIPCIPNDGVLHVHSWSYHI